MAKTEDINIEEELSKIILHILEERPATDEDIAKIVAASVSPCTQRMKWAGKIELRMVGNKKKKMEAEWHLKDDVEET